MTGLAKREPVLAAHVVVWLLAMLGEVLVGHGWLSGAQWSGLSNAVAPIATTAVLAGLGWLTRSVVTPVAKVAEARGLDVDAGLAAALDAAEAIYPAPRG